MNKDELGIHFLNRIANIDPYTFYLKKSTEYLEAFELGVKEYRYTLTYGITAGSLLDAYIFISAKELAKDLDFKK